MFRTKSKALNLLVSTKRDECQSMKKGENLIISKKMIYFRITYNGTWKYYDLLVGYYVGSCLREQKTNKNGKKRFHLKSCGSELVIRQTVINIDFVRVCFLPITNKQSEIFLFASHIHNLSFLYELYPDVH